MFDSFFKKKKPYEILNELKELDIYDETKFEKETLERIKDFKRSLKNVIDFCLDEGVQSKESENRIKSIIKEADDLKNKFNTIENEREETKKNIRVSVERGTEFVVNSHFYPPEYVFNLNKLEGMIVDIDEDKEKNPLFLDKKYDEFRIQIERDIEDFKALHAETIELIGKIDEKLSNKGKESPQAIIEIKEILFRKLQMGLIIEAKAELKKLRKEYKKI